MLEAGKGPAPCAPALEPLPPPACCHCAHGRRASPLTCLAICFLVLTYNLLGGFLFLALEGSVAEETAVAASKPNLSQPAAGGDLRARTVERLWSITEDLNILYKENWTKLAAKELMEFQRVLVKRLRGDAARSGPIHQPDQDYRWTFSTSFLYALTLITTIGAGNVTPASPAGRLVSVAYACVGIPLVLLYLATLGDALARRLRSLYSRLRPPERPPPPAPAGKDPGGGKADWPRRTPFEAALNLETLQSGARGACRDHAPVPALLSLVLVAAYVGLGTLLFHVTERWSLVDGCYFSFSSLATIGFGALRPGRHAAGQSARAQDLAIGACCAYILVGIVVVAMCFNLVHEASSAGLRGAAARCAGSRGRAVRAAPARARPALPVLS